MQTLGTLAIVGWVMVAVFGPIVSEIIRRNTVWVIGLIMGFIIIFGWFMSLYAAIPGNWFMTSSIYWVITVAVFLYFPYIGLVERLADYLRKR